MYSQYTASCPFFSLLTSLKIFHTAADDGCWGHHHSSISGEGKHWRSKCWRLLSMVSNSDLTMLFSECYSLNFLSFSFSWELYHFFSSRCYNITALKDNHYARLCYFIFERYTAFSISEVDTFVPPAVREMLQPYIRFDIFCDSHHNIHPKDHFSEQYFALVLFLMKAKLSPKTDSLSKWVPLCHNPFQHFRGTFNLFRITNTVFFLFWLMMQELFRHCYSMSLKL